MVYLNVTLLGRKKGHLQPKRVVKKVEDTECLSTQLQNCKLSDLEAGLPASQGQLVAHRLGK
jgi:hypothetical protein